MLWDSNAPMQLLKTMPKKLSRENLEKIQMVIDADKYKNSVVNGFDLCGIYAPFCENCNKTSIYPCALAYVKMMQLEGMDIAIDAQPVLLEKKKFKNQIESDMMRSLNSINRKPKPEKENLTVEKRDEARNQESVNAEAVENGTKDEINEAPVQQTIEEIKAIPLEEPIVEEAIESSEELTVNGEQLQIETVKEQPKEEKPVKSIKFRIALAKKKH